MPTATIEAELRDVRALLVQALDEVNEAAESGQTSQRDAIQALELLEAQLSQGFSSPASSFCTVESIGPAIRTQVAETLLGIRSRGSTLQGAATASAPSLPRGAPRQAVPPLVQRNTMSSGNTHFRGKPLPSVSRGAGFPHSARGCRTREVNDAVEQWLSARCPSVSAAERWQGDHMEAKSLSSKLFECPVCLEVMFGKITLCAEGHAICTNGCYETLPEPKVCPQCRSYYGAKPGRGLLVEQIIADAQWSCKYGCGQLTRGRDMSEHLVVCPERPLECPHCGEVVKPASLLEHCHSHRHRVHSVCSDDVGPESAWRAKLTLWELGDHVKHTSILTMVYLEDDDDFVVIEVVFSQDRQDAVVRVFHLYRQRRCHVSFGSRSGLRMSFDVNSTPLHDNVKGRFLRDRAPKGISFSVASAALLAVGHTIQGHVRVLDT